MLHRDFQCHFYFIRHGEAEPNLHPDKIGGRAAESPLTERGIKQARITGARFKKEGIIFDKVYSSSCLRAVQTAEKICEVIGYDQAGIVFTPALVEFSQGEWEGRLREEVYTVETLNYINTKGSFFIPPGGESQRMVERRVSCWLEDEILYNPEYTSRKSPIHIAVVSHGLVIKCLLHYILGCDDRLIWRFKLDYCSITQFFFGKAGWFPICVNDSYHLHGLE